MSFDTFLALSKLAISPSVKIGRLLPCGGAAAFIRCANQTKARLLGRLHFNWADSWFTRSVGERLAGLLFAHPSKEFLEVLFYFSWGLKEIDDQNGFVLVFSESGSECVHVLQNQ